MSKIFKILLTLALFVFLILAPGGGIWATTCYSDGECLPGERCVFPQGTTGTYTRGECQCKPGQLRDAASGLCVTSSELEAGAAVTPAPTDEIYKPPIEPKLQIPIPGLKFSDIIQREEGEARFAYILTLAEYIAGLYRYLIAIAGIIAGIMISYAGVKWLLSAGSPDRIAEAKRKIADAIVGLLLIVGSYTVLYLINPNLLNLSAIRIKLIPKEYFDDAVVGGPESSTQTDLGIFATLVLPPYIATTVKNQEELQMVADAAYSFLEAAEEVYAGQKAPKQRILITSVLRLYEKQCALYKQNCGVPDCSQKSKTKCKTPTCYPGPSQDKTYCPHVSGLAIDVWCEGDTTAKCAKGGNLGVLDEDACPCQKLLTDIMKKKGFCRLSSEIWHFEYKKPGGGYMSGNCR